LVRALGLFECQKKLVALFICGLVARFRQCFEDQSLSIQKLSEKLIWQFINDTKLPAATVAKLVVEQSVPVAEIQQPSSQLPDTLLCGFLP
jgi:hypothetical protein